MSTVVVEIYYRYKVQVIEENSAGKKLNTCLHTNTLTWTIWWTDWCFLLKVKDEPVKSWWHMVYCKCCSKGFNWWLLGRMCAHLHPCWISSQYFCVYSVILKALPMRWLLRYNNKTSICSFLVPFCTYIIFFCSIYSIYVCYTTLRPTQWMETHRLRGPGASHRRVDHPVLLDFACGSLPANVQCVGGWVEDLDVPDRATLHCQARKVGWQEEGTEIRKWKVRQKKRTKSDERKVWQREKVMTGWGERPRSQVVCTDREDGWKGKADDTKELIV